jgi:hypothetical protein
MHSREHEFLSRRQTQIDGLRALAAPSSDQATVVNMLDTAQTDLNKIKSNPALLASGLVSPTLRTWRTPTASQPAPPTARPSHPIRHEA